MALLSLYVPATELPVRRLGDAIDVLKYITALFSFTPPEEPIRRKQTVVGLKKKNFNGFKF